MTTVSNDSFFWGHLAVILFHLGLGAFMIYMYKNKFIYGYRTRRILMWLGILLVVVSLLSIVPIAKYKNEELTIEA